MVRACSIPSIPREGAEPAGGSGCGASTGGLGATDARRTLINDPIAAPCGLQGRERAEAEIRKGDEKERPTAGPNPL